MTCWLQMGAQSSQWENIVTWTANADPGPTSVVLEHIDGATASTPKLSFLYAMPGPLYDTVQIQGPRNVDGTITDFEEGVPYHIAIVSDADNAVLRGYVNGVSSSAAKMDQAPPFTAITQPLNLQVFGQNVIPDVIEELRFFTGALSSTQIEAIYTGNTQQGGGKTVIEGGSIQSGKLQSNNWGASYGSQYNLNDGTFFLGGSSSPKLSWDGSTLLIGAASGSPVIDNYSFGLNSDQQLNAGTASPGLNLTSGYLGYYNGSDWRTYMDSAGNFYLGGTNTGSLMWTSATNELSIVGSIEVTNPNASLYEAGAIYNFGGPSGSVIAKEPLIPIERGGTTGSQWSINDVDLTNANTVNGVLFVSSSDEDWEGEVRSRHSFARGADHTFVADLTIKQVIDDASDPPRMMIGFGDREHTPVGENPSSTYYNTAHAFYFSNDKVTAYEGSTRVAATGIYTGIAEGDKFRIWIHPHETTAGAKYKYLNIPTLLGQLQNLILIQPASDHQKKIRY